jgi:hypothetical protein
MFVVAGGEARLALTPLIDVLHRPPVAVKASGPKAGTRRAWP